jgi:hypothetical protein
MQDSALSKYTVSFGRSLAICAVLNAFLVIIKEKSKTVNGWMTKMAGHHWTAHVLIMLTIFLTLGFVLTPSNRSGETKSSADSLVKLVTAGVIAGVLIIVGFYVIAD